MDKKYRVLFLGTANGRDSFVSNMYDLGITKTMAEEMLLKAPVILKGEMTLGEARLYADAVQEAGGKVNIQEYGLFEEPKREKKANNIQPMESFVMCKECGYKQLRRECCEKCGNQLSKN